MTKWQAIIDTVPLGSMGLCDRSGLGRSNHVDSAYIFLMGVRYIRRTRGIGEKMWVYDNKECTLNTAITVSYLVLRLLQSLGLVVVMHMMTSEWLCVFPSNFQTI